MKSEYQRKTAIAVQVAPPKRAVALILPVGTGKRGRKATSRRVFAKFV
jgi:hypothetical protein